MSGPRPTRILIVTGMSGAGKSTALDTLEDMGWEVVDNLPLVLIDRLLATDIPMGASDARPLAFGIDSRTRGFEARAIVERIESIRKGGAEIATLFLDCSGAELERRFSETRRRHPLALDRPAVDGISRERELMAPLRSLADHVLDTTTFNANQLKADVRARFGGSDGSTTTVSVMSFGFARGIPRNADLVFDMRFLRNPHWIGELKPKSGLESDVAEYIAADTAYPDAMSRIEDLLVTLLPRYAEEGKSYVTIAFGCTGGRHRSVHAADRVSRRLRDAGFSPTVDHRDLTRSPDNSTEGERDRAVAHGGSDGTVEQQ
ncbi:MAG: RNase adapter RapZ [Sphingomonadales bacterium]